MDNFILRKKARKFKQSGSDRPKIYVKPETYEILCEWALETGESLADVTAEAILYAKKHLAWVLED